MVNQKPHILNSISSALHKLGLPKPTHPLIALVDYKDINIRAEDTETSFTAPTQIISRGEDEADYSGYTLLFHPDFIRNYPLAKSITNYGFFSYSVFEALYFSDKERKLFFRSSGRCLWSLI